MNGLGPGSVTQVHRPAEAVAGAVAVHTDSWTSMGQETEKQQRKVVLEGFTVDDEMMTHAAAGAGFYHCLPAYRAPKSPPKSSMARTATCTRRRTTACTRNGALAFLMGVH